MPQSTRKDYVTRAFCRECGSWTGVKHDDGTVRCKNEWCRIYIKGFELVDVDVVDVRDSVRLARAEHEKKKAATKS